MDVIQREIDAIAKYGAKLIASCEPDYPPALAAVGPPPPLVCIKGDASIFRKTGIAIVGARNASAVGRKMARTLAADLGREDFIIVSGLARGIDGEAHATALETGTIAVLAGGIDQPYPPQHRDLYDAIIEQGLVISEAPFGYTATARDFPKRNRIISGLSMATLVVEAAERSGSLITARMALEQGREVMAVPGSPLDPRAGGSNRLIKQGAALIETAEDVIRQMEGLAAPDLFEPAGSGFSHEGAPADIPPALLEAVREALSPTPTPVDEIVRAVDAPLRLVLAAIAELELDGAAVTHVGGLASLSA
jgi:DNA processing protein